MKLTSVLLVAARNTLPKHPQHGFYFCQENQPVNSATISPPTLTA